MLSYLAMISISPVLSSFVVRTLGSDLPLNGRIGCLREVDKNPTIIISDQAIRHA